MACEDSDEGRQRITRRRGACRLCREKKVRCNGRKPCSFCEKHQATCAYTKPPSQAPFSSQHTQTPGPTGRPRQDSAINVDCPVSENASESGDLDRPPWSDVPDFGNLDEGLDLIDFSFGASTHGTEPLIDPKLINHPAPSSTANDAPFHIHDFDWSLSPLNQDDVPATAESDRRILEQMPEPTAAPLTLDGSEARVGLTAGLESPTKRRRLHSLPSTLVLGSGERLQSVLFPNITHNKTSSTNIPSSYNPYVSFLFPSSRRVENKVGESKKNTVNRIVTRLLSRDYLLGFPTSWADNFAEYQGQDVCHFLESPSVLPMEKLVNLCFNEPWGVSCFLNKPDVLMLIQKHDCVEGERSQDAIPIIDIFLLGILATWGATIHTDERPGLACTMTMQIMDLRHAVVLEPDSISKFLALVAMLQYAFKVGLSQFPVILAETVSVAQSLNLHLEAGLEGVCPVRASMIEVKRACWVLFCVDKTYAMRWRTFSLLPDIEYDPPLLRPAGRNPHEPRPSHDRESQENDWLLSQCTYAKICARISKGFASLSSAAIVAATAPGDSDNSTRTATNASTPQEEAHEFLAHSLLVDLQSWYESVPREGRPISLAKAAASTSSQRHIAISTAYQYHEAVLAVLSLLSQTSSLTPSPSAPRLPQLAATPGAATSSAATMLLGSIKGVLTLSNHVSDITDDRTLLYVPTLALCTLAVEHVKGNPTTVSAPSAQRECRALFAMAYGFFGRLAGMLPHGEFFDRVAELFEAVNGC